MLDYLVGLNVIIHLGSRRVTVRERLKATCFDDGGMVMSPGNL